MQASVYDTKGKEVKKVDLPETVFDLPWNADLVHQVVVSLESNKRQGSAHTKDRSEVRGGGKKPWKQKGTGRARHGSRRSPIWVGGGVTFGPRNDKDYSKKINRKMKVKAFNTILSQKVRDGEIIFIDALSFEIPKTKDAKEVLKSLASIKGYETLATKRKNAAVIATSDYNATSFRSFRNFGNIKLNTLNDIDLIDVVNHKYLIIENPEKVIPTLQAKIK